MAGRGLRYTLGILFCRVIPASIFRYRCMEIVRLDDVSKKDVPKNQGANQRSEEAPYRVRLAESSDELAKIERVTLFDRCSYQQSAGSGIASDSDEPSLSAYGLARDTVSGSKVGATEPAQSWSEIVGGVWIATDRFIESDLHLQIDLAKHQRWLFAARLSPEVRGRGAYSTLLHEVLAAESPTGSGAASQVTARDEVTAVWAAINPTNHRSVRAHARFRIATAGRIHLIRIGSLAVGWRGRSSAGFQLSINRSWTIRGTEFPILMRVTKV
ncbi:hypothetical protein RISK_000753 [Rhodopirellula islandica]|uniref:Uncharacterized protein n=1 Tax=Rhodopirellula islandica TaxID=595434 RepID=A0A0J1BKB7_RHOIS|nr:hypothetical protein [Rhodopirellula islandica]KLU06952.1 hypothetical protein RISK_000753 [Rhodopirellula islandica]